MIPSLFMGLLASWRAVGCPSPPISGAARARLERGSERDQASKGARAYAKSHERHSSWVCGMTHNKQLQRTVERHRGDAARAPFHYARAARFKRQRAAAELRR
jgi:hypothetical protein